MVSCRGEFGDGELPSEDPAPGDDPLGRALEEPKGYRMDELPFWWLSDLGSNGGGGGCGGCG